MNKLEKADRIFSRAIRKRSMIGNVVYCYICGKPISLNESHIMHYMSRNNKGTRFDEMNCKPGCFDCNVKENGRIEDYRKKLVEEYSEAEICELERKARRLNKLSESDLDEIINTYKKWT